MTISKTVYAGRDNVFFLTFTQSNGAGVETPLDLSAVYSLTLELLGSGIAATEYTALGAGNILDTSPGAGVLGCRPGLIPSIPIGAFPIRLFAKSSVGDTNPTQLTHERGESVVVEVVPFTASLVLEDGTGLTSSVTYSSVADADSYHYARRNLAWAQAAIIDREAALVRATDYIDRRWGPRMLGRRLSSAQALEWPRTHVWDEFGTLRAGVPREIRMACAEYALRALSDSLAPDPVLSANGRIVRKLERVEGAVTEETEYAPGFAAPELRPYPLADAMLARLVRSNELLRG